MKTAITFMFSLFCLALASQPTITSDWTPKVGFKAATTEVDVAPDDPGPSGENVTWDFSSFVVPDSSESIEFTFVTPESTPYAASYPDATLAFANLDYDIYSYLIADQTGIYDIGSTFGGAIESNYSDPQTFLTFPLTFGSTIDDNYAGTSSFVGVTTYVTGSVSSEVDGYGSLLLPGSNEEINNVLRMRTVEENTDSTDLGAGIKEKVFTRTISYEWLSPDYSLPLASWSDYSGYQTAIVDNLPPDTLFFEGDSDFTFDRGFFTAKTKVVQPDLFSMKISPNPSQDEISIRFEMDISQTYEVQILDHQGRLLKHEKDFGTAGQNTKTVAVDDLMSGLYLFRFITGNRESTQPFVKK